MSELSKRLRLASTAADDWDYESMSDPPVYDWAELMEEAADALEALEGDVADQTQSAEAPQTVE